MRVFTITTTLVSLLAAGSLAQQEGLHLPEVVNGAVGPFEGHCDGYGNPGASGLGYISVLKLEIGMVEADMDEVLEDIVSYDRAEASGTYVGQINMLQASSFNGINGAVWGYHLVRADQIADGSLTPLFTIQRKDGVKVPIYSLDPLLDAGRRLLGTAEHRRFPLLPGAHVICAVKSKTVRGPDSVWCAAALAIAEDRQRDSNLFIEDVGSSIPAETPEDRTRFTDDLMHKIALSIVRCGEDSGVSYREIFMGCKAAWVPEGQVGCAITCAPYLVLARQAIPKDQAPAALLDMTVSQWEKALELPPLPEE